MYEAALDRWLSGDRRRCPARDAPLFSVLDKESRGESLTPDEQQLLVDAREAAKTHARKQDSA